MRAKHLSHLLLLSLLLTGCFSINRDLSTLSPYNKIMGKQFKTKIELVIYSVRDNRKNLLIGKWDQTFPDREEIETTSPITYQDKIVRGFLPPATELKVVDVREQGSISLTWICPYVEITNSSAPQWIGKIAYPIGIIDYRNNQEIPMLDSKFAEEISNER